MHPQRRRQPTAGFVDQPGTAGARARAPRSALRPVVSAGYGPDGKTWRRRALAGRTGAKAAAKLPEFQGEQDSGAEPTRGHTIRWPWTTGWPRA